MLVLLYLFILSIITVLTFEQCPIFIFSKRADQDEIRARLELVRLEREAATPGEVTAPETAAPAAQVASSNNI
jgi:hypothetical protein